MTAYNAQIHCSGVAGVLYNETFVRTFALSNAMKFFPLARESGLGFDFACSSCDLAVGSVAGAAPRVNAETKFAVDCIEQLCRANTDALLDLEGHLGKECIISPINCS